MRSVRYQNAAILPPGGAVRQRERVPFFRAAVMPGGGGQYWRVSSRAGRDSGRIGTLPDTGDPAKRSRGLSPARKPGRRRKGGRSATWHGPAGAVSWSTRRESPILRIPCQTIPLASCRMPCRSLRRGNSAPVLYRYPQPAEWRCTIVFGIPAPRHGVRALGIDPVRCTGPEGRVNIPEHCRGESVGAAVPAAISFHRQANPI